MEFRVRWTPQLLGFVGALSLFAFYTGILTLFSGFNHAVEQFARYWYFIVPLIAGFGVEVGLIAFMHYQSKASGMVTLSGAMSAGSMIACCAHHVTDFVPLLGLSAIGLLLADYTPVFLLFGVLSNVIGIAFMLRQLQKARLLKNVEYFSKLNFDVLFKATLGVSALLFVGYLAVFPAPSFGVNAPSSAGVPASSLKTLSDSQLGIVFEVTPILNKDRLAFDVQINNHRYNLAFDLTKVSELVINGEKLVQPIQWDGSSMGGHHASGTLIFDENPRKVHGLELTIQALNTTRVFRWDEL